MMISIWPAERYYTYLEVSPSQSPANCTSKGSILCVCARTTSIVASKISDEMSVHADTAYPIGGFLESILFEAYHVLIRNDSSK